MNSVQTNAQQTHNKLTTKTMASTMEIMLQSQLENFAKTLAAQGSLTPEQLAAAIAQSKVMMESIDVPAAPKRTRKVKEVDEEDRCMARVWDGGNGSQCKSSKIEGGDYCKRCTKLADVTETPLSFDEAGKHIGLFWGRMDQPLPHFCDGMLVCQWKSAESKAVVTAALAEGKTFHPFSGEAKKKSRSGSSKKSARKPRAKKSKKAIRSSVPRAKNPFMFFLAEKRPEIRAKLVADAEANPVMETNEAGEQIAVIQKVPVSAVAKIAGEIWRDLSEEDRAPYVAKADASKAEREAKIAEMEEELNSLADDNSTIATEEEPSTPVSEANQVVMPPPAPKKTTVSKKAAALPKISQFDLSDPITAACFKGVDDAGNVHPTSESVSDAEDDEMSAVTEATGEVEELDGAEEEGEEVEEHTLADGTDVLKGADGTIYDPESYEPIGKWNKADNTLVEA